MLNNIIKVSFSVVGAVTAYSIVRTIIFYNNMHLSNNLETIIYIIVALLMALLFFSIGTKIIDFVIISFDKIETKIQSMTLYELSINAVGLISGLIIANLITIPVNRISFIGVPLSIFSNILFGCLGIFIASGKRHDAIIEDFKFKKNGKIKSDSLYPKAKILDTSVIIDGRIVDICRTGFIEGELIIPDFVLEELRHIADSADSLKRSKGRRGLDILNILQKDLNFPIKIVNYESNENDEVDEKLLKLAKALNSKVLTNDYNLNKVASLQGINVLNINDLANSVKPLAVSGEEFDVAIIKDGKENGQGIGYLDDGTMIVVEGGNSFIGEKIRVEVTSFLQTSAGKMIFAKPKYSIGNAILNAIDN